MINVYPIASEMVPTHPTAQLWRKRKAALLNAGYIETRQLHMRHNLAAKGAVEGFFAAFHSRFPGVECSVKDSKSDKPLVIVTARKSDFGTLGPIERFVDLLRARSMKVDSRATPNNSSRWVRGGALTCFPVARKTCLMPTKASGRRRMPFRQNRIQWPSP